MGKDECAVKCTQVELAMMMLDATKAATKVLMECVTKVLPIPRRARACAENVERNLGAQETSEEAHTDDSENKVDEVKEKTPSSVNTEPAEEALAEVLEPHTIINDLESDDDDPD